MLTFEQAVEKAEQYIGYSSDRLATGGSHSYIAAYAAQAQVYASLALAIAEKQKADQMKEPERPKDLL